jgi:CRP-like cAMP-binding protein
MPTKAFKAQLDGNAALRKLLARYTFVMVKQIVQTAACTRYHVIEQRLARWLLMTADRSHAPKFHITHAFLAMMLGVRRVGVTTAAAALSGRGLIRYSRGHMAILDRKGLQSTACGCYRSDIDVYRTIMGADSTGGKHP